MTEPFLSLDSLNKSKTKMNTYTNSNKIRKEFPNEICSSKVVFWVFL